VQASLSFAGVRLLDNMAVSQQAIVAPGARARFIWRAQVLDVVGVSLNVSARTAGGSVQIAKIEQPILPSNLVQERAGGALVEDQSTQVFTTSLERGDEQLTLSVAASSAALAREAARLTAAATERNTLDEAGLLLISAPLSDTQPLAREAIGRMLAGRNEDGGWGWWPGGRSEPFVTSVALEALAAASEAGFDTLRLPTDGGIARLQAALRDPATGADQRAQILYVLARYGKAEDTALSNLAAEPAALGPQGLAYLLLARPPQAAWDDQPIVDRLAALATLAGNQVFWTTRRDNALLDSDTSVTALALLALEQTQPNNELIAGARSWLAAAPFEGGYTAARALAALRATDPPATDQAGGRYTITLNGSQLLDQPLSEIVTTTRTLHLLASQLHERNELTATSSGGALFLRYQLASAPVLPPHDGGIALLHEYLDPLTGQPLDLSRLRAGQLVRARLTVLTTELRRFVAIADPLPANTQIISMEESDDFEYASHTSGQLTLASARLAPGVYQYSYLLRLVAGGRYTTPAPTAHSADGAGGVGNTSRLEVAAQ
jgi:uncharacterized protein YfaS (alpha-2-macroglobulin family)